MFVKISNFIKKDPRGSFWSVGLIGRIKLGEREW
jgi:hypothetical protein